MALVMRRDLDGSRGEVKQRVLNRTGQAPLVFDGELIAMATGKSVGGKERPRYHAVELYRTADERFIVGVSYLTTWDGELGHEDAEACDSLEAVVNHLRAYDPTARVMGFPPGVQFAEKQRRLLLEIRSQYEHLVTTLLTSAGVVEQI